MGYTTLLPEGRESREHYLSFHLPKRYMEDFTLLGFVVPSFTKALKLLDKANYVITEKNGGARIHINSPKELHNISNLLIDNNFSYEYGDLADSIYQA